MSRIVEIDLDTASSSTLHQLAHLAREREQREYAERERQVERMAEVMGKPTIGWYLRHRSERS